MSYTQRLEDCLTDTASQVHRGKVQMLSTDMTRKDASRWQSIEDQPRVYRRTQYVAPHMQHASDRNHLFSSGNWTGGEN